MSDASLFAFGCGVVFLFMVGAYVLFRASFTATSASPDAGTRVRSH
jgi:hypothetical protein